jgi:translation initiation factor 4E
VGRSSQCKRELILNPPYRDGQADNTEQGGKWVILFRNSPYLLDQAWANLTMALVGEILDPDDEVCGVVASTRPKIDRVQVWTRDREDVDKINSIGKRIVEIIRRQAETMSLEFQVSEEYTQNSSETDMICYQWNASNSTPAADRYYNIPFPMAQPQSQRSSMPHAPPTPSRLGHNLTPNPGNISPIPPRSPTSGEFLIPMQFTHSGGMSVSPRRGTSGGINAFAGPMGGGVRNGSLGGMGTLGRRDSSQSIGGVTAGANR